MGGTGVVIGCLKKAIWFQDGINIIAHIIMRSVFLTTKFLLYLIKAGLNALHSPQHTKSY